MKKKHTKDQQHDRSISMTGQSKETTGHERTTSSNTKTNEEYLPKLSRSELPQDDTDGTLL